MCFGFTLLLLHRERRDGGEKGRSSPELHEDTPPTLPLIGYMALVSGIRVMIGPGEGKDFKMSQSEEG
ncbi:unnamed protein product [Pleuronectes platessa]|uniref:Uncharacterized protein n=1 Tax=Pleuronectes platessa TaxID=8262 RepID=A0A9N7Z2E2_PLEPL|nr:unnamed protein product [Pleuronectes platessa]